MMHLNGGLINFENFDELVVNKKKAYMNAANGGANSGFEIDNLKLFEEHARANEDPEFNQNIDLLISCEAYVNQLLEFQNRVNATNGMSRGMAHELLELIPTLESFTSPKHFTTMVSNVGLEMSLESINVKIFAMIAAAIAFVVGMIYKFTSWFSKGKTSNASSLADESIAEIKDAEEKISENSGKLGEMVQLMTTLKSAPPEPVTIPADITIETVEHMRLPASIKEPLLRALEDPKFEVYQTREEMEKAAHEHALKNSTRDFDNLVDPPRVIEFNMHEMLNDIGEDGGTFRDFIETKNKYVLLALQKHKPSTQFIVDLVDSFEQLTRPMIRYCNYMGSIADYMLDSAEKNGFNEGHTAQVKTMLAGMTDGRPGSDIQLNGETIPDIEERIKQDSIIRIGVLQFASVEAVFAQVQDLIENESHHHPKFTSVTEFVEDYADAYMRLSKAKINELAVVFKSLKQAQKVFDKAENDFNYIQSEGARYRNNQEMVEAGGFMMRASRAVSTDLRYIIKMYQEITEIYSALDNKARLAFILIARNAQGLVRFYKRFGEKVPDVLAKFAKEVDDLSDEMENNVVPPGFTKGGIPVIKTPDFRVTTTINGVVQVEGENTKPKMSDEERDRLFEEQKAKMAAMKAARAAEAVVSNDTPSSTDYSAPPGVG